MDIVETSKWHILGQKHALWRIDRSDRSRNATWVALKKAKKEKKLGDVTSHVCTQTTHVALPASNLSSGVGPGRSQPCQVSSELVKGFWLPEGSKSAFFQYLTIWLIQQVRATAQPVMHITCIITEIHSLVWLLRPNYT